MQSNSIYCYRKITAIPTTDVESVNDIVTAVSSTSLSSFEEGKSETLTDQQTVKGKKKKILFLV